MAYGSIVFLNAEGMVFHSLSTAYHEAKGHHYSTVDTKNPA